MNNSHAHSAFYRIFVKIILFMARPIDFHRLEANRPNRWDDSSQGQANRPSGKAIRPSSVVSPVSPVFFSFQSDVSIFLILKFPFELNLTVACQNHLCPFLFIPFCIVSFGLFSVYYVVLSMLSVYLCGFVSFLSVRFM